MQDHLNHIHACWRYGHKLQQIMVPVADEETCIQYGKLFDADAAAVHLLGVPGNAVLNELMASLVESLNPSP